MRGNNFKHFLIITCMGLSQKQFLFVIPINLCLTALVRKAPFSAEQGEVKNLTYI
jgi:hypothetical protein